MKLLKIACLALVLTFFQTSLTVSQDTPLYGQEGNWDIFQFTNGEDPNCIAFLEFTFSDGTDGALGFVHYPDMIILSITQSDWDLPVDEIYDVFLQFDGQESLSVEALTNDPQTLAFFEDFTDWVNASNNPSTFYLHTPQTTFTYDVKGLQRANTMARNCIYETINPTGNNPFLNTKPTGSNPFQDQQTAGVFTTRGITDFSIEPALSLESYISLLPDFEAAEISAVTQTSTFEIGAYETLIADTIYNLYWEEDTSTRETPRVFGDFVAWLNSECIGMASNLLSEVQFENHNFYQGSIACSLRDSPEDKLYFRLSIYDLGDGAMLFLTFSGSENQELVDIIDDSLDLNDFLTETLGS